MQPTSGGKPRGTKTNKCGTRRTRRTRGPHPETRPEATCKSPGTHSTNLQRTCAPSVCGAPSPAPSPACLAAPRTVAVVVAEVPAVVAVVGVVAVAVAAALVAVEDTRVAAGTRGAGTCTGRIHTGGSRSLKAFPDPSSSARTRTAAHSRTAAHTDTHAAAATPPSLSAEHVERAKQLKHGKANPEAGKGATRWTGGVREGTRNTCSTPAKR